MGAIQGAFNSALGAAAAVAVAGKKMGEAKEAKLEGAKEDLSFSEAELAGAQAHQAESSLALEGGQKSLDEAAAAEKDAGKFMRSVARDKTYSKEDKALAKQMHKQALDDLEAAKKAFGVLEKKDLAAKAMTAR